MEDREQIHASRGKDSQVTLLALPDKLNNFLRLFLRDRLGSICKGVLEEGGRLEYYGK